MSKKKRTQGELVEWLQSFKNVYLDTSSPFPDSEENIEQAFNQIKEQLQQKRTVTEEWIGDLENLFFDLEHSHEEPVDRSDGQKSKDEVWMEIEKMFSGIDVKVLRSELKSAGK